MEGNWTKPAVWYTFTKHKINQEIHFYLDNLKAISFPNKKELVLFSTCIYSMI